MKVILISIIFGLLSVAQAKVEYNCQPMEASFNNPVEGAVVASEGGALTLGYYTTSDTWGAVDEWIDSATLTQEGAVVTVKSADATLVINRDKLVGDMEGEFISLLTVPGKSLQAELICNEGDF